MSTNDQRSEAQPSPIEVLQLLLADREPPTRKAMMRIAADKTLREEFFRAFDKLRKHQRFTVLQHLAPLRSELGGRLDVYLEKHSRHHAEPTTRGWFWLTIGLAAWAFRISPVYDERFPDPPYWYDWIMFAFSAGMFYGVIVVATRRQQRTYYRLWQFYREEKERRAPS